MTKKWFIILMLYLFTFTVVVEAIDKAKLTFSNFLVWYHRDTFPSTRKRSYLSSCQLIVFGHKEINEKYTFNYTYAKDMKNLLNY